MVGPKIIFTLLLFSVSAVRAMGDDSSGLKLPIFNGLKSQWSLWLMSFGAFLATKYSDVHELFNGDSNPPIVPPPDGHNGNNVEI